MKLLGVTVQNNLKWDIHVAEIVTKASRKLYTLCILRKSVVPTSDMLAVYTCYVRTHFGVCLPGLAQFNH